MFPDQSASRNFCKTLFFTLTTLLVVAGCDSAGLPQTGGSAGDGNDTGDQSEAIALISPFVGYYLLQDGWNGMTGDVGYLVIDPPGSDGTARALLYDFDDIDNCVPSRPFTGVVSKDILSNRVFMDGILQFDQAELLRSGSSIVIEFLNPGNIINDESDQNTARIQATDLGISSVADLGDAC